MKAKVIRVIERMGGSNHTSKCYIFCLKGTDGESYRTWTDQTLGNFKRWYDVICGFVMCEKTHDELWLDDLAMRRGHQKEVDADSHFKIEIVTPPAIPFVPNHTAVLSSERPRKDFE